MVSSTFSAASLNLNPGSLGVIKKFQLGSFFGGSNLGFNVVQQLTISQIPYSLTKQEVLGFLGRNAKIVTPDLGVPIHIIMDRSTGKTMDCYGKLLVVTYTSF